MPPLAKIRWYAHRLASMSAPEILHRMRETVKRRRDRASSPATGLLEDHGMLPYMPGLREALGRWEVPETLLSEWRGTLARARNGTFQLLGRTWPPSDRDSRWHLDPVTSTFWPADRYCFDINYRHKSAKGDVKYVWEIGRLQYLQPITALAFVRKDPDTARFALAEIESWIDCNPPHLGVHWASGIELALRTVSILTVTTLCGEFATEAQRTKIIGTLYAHACWLDRYPSLYSSANNHRAAEGLGLFLVGGLCPRLPDAGRFRAVGWTILCECAGKLILSDGAGAEQAITYTAFTAEILLLALRMAHGLEMEVPAAYTQRLASAGEYLRWLTDAGGNQPLIGDDDGGRVIGPNTPAEGYASSVLGAIAGVLHRPDLTPPKSAAHLRQAFFGFPPAATEAPQGTRHFPEGGYTVFRHDDKLLAFDHGPLGYLSIAAHGHADALAIWLHIGESPVLVDAGTYLYHSGGDLRRHFRGTGAHNTLCLEGADASIMSGNFNWSHKARVHLIAFEENGPDGGHIEAEHDGYKKRFGAIHRRRLDVAGAGGFTVTDSITAGTSHSASIGFLLHPLLRAESHGHAIHVLKDDRLLLRVTHEGPLTTELQTAEYSPSFGVKEPATRIVFTGTLAPEQRAVARFTYG